VLKGALIGVLFGSEVVPEEHVCDVGDLPFIKVGSMSLNSFSIESWDWFIEPSVVDQYTTRTNYVVFPKRGAAIFTNKVNIVDRPSLIDPNLMGWEIGKAAYPPASGTTISGARIARM
jgi:type I restriction enzyme S subunit